MRISGKSDVGMLRTENQDAFSAFPLQGLDAVFAIVCDGIGGGAGGKEAADTCVATFEKRFSGAPVPSAELLLETLGEANSRVLARAEEKNFIGMATTVVAAALTPDLVTLLWLGDSRAYLWHEGSLVRCTKDHSYVQALVDEGHITEKEAKTHAYRNLITRAVGASDVALGESCSFPWGAGDRLLLCTDGLTAMMGEDEICEILSEDGSPGVTVHELISAANCHGGEDNITVLVLENVKETTSDA